MRNAEKMPQVFHAAIVVSSRYIIPTSLELTLSVISLVLHKGAKFSDLSMNRSDSIFQSKEDFKADAHEGFIFRAYSRVNFHDYCLHTEEHSVGACDILWYMHAGAFSSSFNLPLDLSPK